MSITLARTPKRASGAILAILAILAIVQKGTMSAILAALAIRARLMRELSARHRYRLTQAGHMCSSGTSENWKLVLRMDSTPPSPSSPSSPQPPYTSQPSTPQPSSPQPQPGYTPPGYPQPGYPQPGYTPPGYLPPGYAQQGSPPPGYTPPGYTPPGYTPPGYTPPGYTPPTRPLGRPPRRRRSAFWMAAGLFLIPVVTCAALIVATAISQPELLARNLSFLPLMRVTGTVYGEDAAQREAGREAMVPVAGATIACGRESAVADAQGHYSLSEFPGRDYTCSVSAAGFATMTAHIQAQFATSYALDFGSPSATTSGGACASASDGQRCGALRLQPGSISGVIADSGTGKPINSASVDCWDDSLAARASMNDPTRYGAVANAQGQYVVTDAPVGPYLCVAARSGAAEQVVVRPGAVASLDFSVCQSHCHGVSYHGGDVMNTFTAYVIYWTPPGTRLDPNGSDARYHSLVEQYLNDVGGTPFFEILTQYWDSAGPVRDISRLAGTYVDTHPYPHAGTQADPLNDSDIYREIERVSASQHWRVDPGVGFALITSYGIQTCATYEGHRSCSFPLSDDTGFCAYHSATSYSSGDTTADYLPYMLVTNVPGCDSLPTFDMGPAPYGAPVVDAAINSLSHEQFEMISDPAGEGWYDNSDFFEIGDKCETSFGDPASDGSDVRLAHGHGYVLQREWSAASNSCTYK